MGIQGNENSFFTRDFRIGPDDSISYYFHLNQYITDKQNLEKKIEDVDKKLQIHVV